MINNITEKELKEMKLHEELRIDKVTFVLRVYKGWIYNFIGPKDNMSSVFVPDDSVTFNPASLIK